jgi:hypothetical protein
MRKTTVAFLAILVLAASGCGQSKEDELFSKIEPVLISPEDGKVMTQFPRNAVLTWRKVEGAERYMVEIEMQNPLDGRWMPAPVYLNRRVVDTERLKIEFPGSQPGRWRVVAITPEGVKSRASEWWRFEFVAASRE